MILDIEIGFVSFREAFDFADGTFSDKPGRSVVFLLQIIDDEGEFGGFGGKCHDIADFDQVTRNIDAFAVHSNIAVGDELAAWGRVFAKPRR